MYYVDVMKKIVGALENTNEKLEPLFGDIIKDRETLQSLIAAKDEIKRLINEDPNILSPDDITAKKNILRVLDELDLSNKLNNRSLSNIELDIIGNENEAASQTKQASIQGTVEISTINNYTASVTNLSNSVRAKLNVVNKEHAIVEKLLTEFCDSVGLCLVKTKKLSKMIDELIADKLRKATELFEDDLLKKMKKAETNGSVVFQKVSEESKNVKNDLISIKNYCTNAITRLEDKYKSMASDLSRLQMFVKNETKTIKDNITGIINALNQL